jgi:hypothetical protein
MKLRGRKNVEVEGAAFSINKLINDGKVIT